MDIHCHGGAADDHQDWRTTSSTFARRRGGLPPDGATPATSPGAELSALELLTPSVLARALADWPEAESLGLKADLVRRAGYVSAETPFDATQALHEAAARRLTALLAAASDAEAELRGRR